MVSYRTVAVSQRGMSLIELLLVLAIASIVALFAIPAYQDNVVRAQIATQLSRIKAIRIQVEEYVAYYGTLPITNVEARLGSPASYATDVVSQIYLDTSPVEGSLIVEFTIGRLGAANKLIYNPSLIDGKVVWSCDFSTMESKFLPDNCQH